MQMAIPLLSVVVLTLADAPCARGAHAALTDRPFLQDQSVRFRMDAALSKAEFRRLEIDRDGAIYVLTDRGVARVYGDTLTLDRSFRPLTGLLAKDITLGRGWLYYLFEDRWLSNGDSGRPLGHLPARGFSTLAVAEDGSVLAGGTQTAMLFRAGSPPRMVTDISLTPVRWFAHGEEFFGLTPDIIYRLSNGVSRAFHYGSELTALAFRGEELLLGTQKGYYGISLRTGAISTARQEKLPVAHLTCLAPVTGGLWAGTTRGVFLQRPPGPSTGAGPALPEGPGGLRYYASKRWLPDDVVVDLKAEADGSVLVLTRTGLTRIELKPTTLAAKADWFDRRMRSRHIRFGLAGERRLPVPGEVTSSEIVDTDNDGGWSCYYLASQVFRYAATGNASARSNAWEIFDALQRLREFGGTNGFFARTFERKGFKYSDPDRWRDWPGDDWEWKGHTSSDEFTSHTFAHALLWELVANNPAERRRLADNYTAILDHILQHALYLVDVDGKPTLWGRWNPEYVNHYPPSVGDRRLNSAEIIAGLQLGWAMTGRALYRDKAYELFARHGYLTNILSSMKLIAYTPDQIHQGNNMGDEWNHSDDELSFVNYWVLYRFAFTQKLRRLYADAIQDHWRFEAAEKFPIWNFIYSACGGGRACDVAGAVWTLQGWPLDTITWRIQNSHRLDLTPLPRNFYGRQSAELLPPGERPITRLNTQTLLLDGGDGGGTELPGDEFLFGYWLGRYLKLIR